MLTIGFAGTPHFARVALEALYQVGFPVQVVLTQPDRPAGRGLKLQPSPVKELALQHGTLLMQPQSLKQGEAAEQVLHVLRTGAAGQPLDVLVVAAYGLILPQAVLDAPRLGCLNIHASLLPRWRGAAPIHRAIEAGDTQTGVCIMQMEAGLDTGPVRMQQAMAISPVDTTATLHNRLAELGAILVVQALQQLQAEILPIQPQPQEGITYAHKISKAEGLLDWQQPAQVLQRRVRAFDPNPGAYFLTQGQAIKCFTPQCVNMATIQTSSQPSNQPSSQTQQPSPGTVLAIEADGVVVQCGHGALRLATLQKPGGKRSAAQQVLAALGVEVGCALL